MTIRDRERYSGSVFLRLVDQWEGSLCFQKLEGKGVGFYLIGSSLPVFIKYSKARRGPWTFTFQPDHLAAYRGVADAYGDCIATFICGTDGIAAVDFGQFGKLVDAASEVQEAIAVKRRLKEMYAISGSKGTLDGKVARYSLLAAVRRHFTGK
jgi:hypothetical protein